MAEYIERETAVKAVMAAKWVDGSDGAMAMEIVASQAAADVATVVHGWWNADETCSVCGEKSTEGLDAVKWDYWLPDYCPHCGAIMDGGADHEADRRRVIGRTVWNFRCRYFSKRRNPIRPHRGCRSCDAVQGLSVIQQTENGMV